MRFYPNGSDPHWSRTTTVFDGHLFTKKYFTDPAPKSYIKLDGFLPKKTFPYTNLLTPYIEHSQCWIKRETTFCTILQTAERCENTANRKMAIDYNIRFFWLCNTNPVTSSNTWAQIRHRLLLLGDLKQDSKALTTMRNWRSELKKRNGYGPDPIITNTNIMLPWTPHWEYIKTIT
jgi:hypothetical protein